MLTASFITAYLSKTLVRRWRTAAKYSRADVTGG